MSVKTVKSEVPATGKARQFNWPRIFGYDFFISFKLGPPPIGTQSYASDLARRLRELDFTVFYSEEEAPPGAKLDTTLIKALHRSRILVVVANEGALVQSQWVRKEVEEFRRKHPKRPVIPINVGRAIEKFGPQAEASKWLDHDGRIWLDETNEAINEGILNPEVLRRLQIVPRFTKANTWFRRMVAAIILILIGLTSWAGYEAWDANRKFRDATAMRLVAEGGSMTSGQRPGGTIQGLFKVLAANKLTRSANTDEALHAEYSKFCQMIYTRQTPSKIASLVFSPDGNHIVTGSDDGNLRLWDVKNGIAGPPIKGHKYSISQVGFSPDGSLILSRSEHESSRLWDAKTGKAVGQPLGDDGYPFDIAFSPDSNRIVSFDDGVFFTSHLGQPAKIVKTLHLWNAQTGEPVGLPLVAKVYGVASIAFSPDGGRLVTGDIEHMLHLWDTKTGVSLSQPFQGHKEAITRVVFSPDGSQIVSGSEDKTLRLWDIKTGIPISQPLKGHKGSITTLAFSPDGKKILSGSEDKTLRLWDAKTGHAIGLPLTGHEFEIDSAAFNAEGKRIISVAADGTRLWDADKGEQIEIPQLLKVPGSDIFHRGAFSRDGAFIFSSSNDQTPGSTTWGKNFTSLTLWDAKSGDHIGKAVKGFDGYFSSEAVSPDGSVAATISMDDTLRLWDMQTDRCAGQPVKDQKGWVYSVAFSPDGFRVISGNRDGTLRLWDAKTGEPIGQPFVGHKNAVMSVAFSRDGNHIVSGSMDNTLRLWDAKTGIPIGLPLNGHESWVDSVAFSPDGSRVVSGSNDHTLRLWDAKTGAPIGQPLKGHESGVNGVAFSSDGNLIVSGSYDKTLRLWDARNGKPIGQPLEGHEDFVNSVVFSPDGSHIISGSEDGTLRLWDVKTGKPIRQPSKYKYMDHVYGQVINSVSITRDGSRIVSGNKNGTLQLWEAKTGRPIGQPFESYSGSIHSVAFSPDGNNIVSGSDGDDVTLHLWPVFESWAVALCKKLGRNMSHKEWNEWVSPDIDYIEQCPGLPIPPDEPEATAAVTEPTQP